MSIPRHPEDKQFTEAWGFLPHSKVRIKCFIEDCLKIFDKNIKVSVSLLCITKKEPKYICCASKLFDSNDFNSIPALAKELFNNDSERNIIHSHPRAHRKMLEDREVNSYCNAIKMKCETSHVAEEEEFFVFGPNETESFSIYIIFSIKKDILNRYFHLSKANDGRISLSKSFIYSCIQVVGYHICSTKINDDDPIIIDYDVKNIHRKAAKILSSRLCIFNNTYSGQDIYDTMNIVSSLRYEKKESPSRIIFTPSDNKNVKLKIQFENPSRLNDYRKTRKLLELTDEENYIISDGLDIYGIGCIANDYNQNDETVFIANINGHYSWDMNCNGNMLFRSEYETILISKTNFDRTSLYDTVKRVFKTNDSSILNKYYDIISKCIHDEHGAILVFMNNAEEEARRLSNDGIKSPPFDATEKNISLLTKIDGAVLLDTVCKCHSFGVILDGMAAGASDISRGARYNSSIRYFYRKSKETNIMIVVVSDDGMINIIPDLMPLISKEYLQTLVDKFACLDEQDFDSTEYHSVYDKLDALRFYITQEMCDIINPIIEKSNTYLRAHLEVRQIFLPRHEFTICPDMNDSYFAENNYPAVENTVWKFKQN